MAQNPDDKDPNDIAPLSQRDQEEQALKLTKQIAERYSTRRLSKMVSSWAGSVDRLDATTKGFLERKVGIGLDGVRILRGPVADALTDKFNAHAVTIAKTRTVVLNSKSPKTVRGSTAFSALLAHEFTHVGQAQKGLHFDQKSGGVDSPHEREAHAAEHSVLAGAADVAKHGSSDAERKAARDKAIIAEVFKLMEEESYRRWETSSRD